MLWWRFWWWRRWYGWNRYNWAMGGKIDTNYDWTRKLSTGLSLRIMANKYDEYGDYMNGQTYSVYNYASYSLDATKYIVLRGNIDRDTAKTPGWADWRYGAGIGFGSELPLGFTYIWNLILHGQTMMVPGGLWFLIMILCHKHK